MSILLPDTPVVALWPEPRTPVAGRLYGALRRAGIHDVATLTTCTHWRLLEEKGIGPGGVDEIRRALACHGLHLRGDEVAS